MVASLSVLYPSSEAFDIEYYLGKHIPLVKELWPKYGLLSLDVIKYGASPDGSQPYTLGTHLKWESAEGIQKATDMNTRDGKAVMGDIPNFYKGKPVVVVGEAKEQYVN